MNEVRVSDRCLRQRRVTRVVVKRNNPRLVDPYGHWWIEIDGVESYGWWPAVHPVSIASALRGVPGVLNGVGGPAGGSPTVDPRHSERADHGFHPTAIGGCADEEVITALRRFAATFEGGWRWSFRPTVNCRSFQADLLAAAGLAVPDGYGHTGGAGCPFLAPLRRWRRQVARRRHHDDAGRRPVRSRLHAAVLTAVTVLFVAGRPSFLLPLQRRFGRPRAPAAVSVRRAAPTVPSRWALTADRAAAAVGSIVLLSVAQRLEGPLDDLDQPSSGSGSSTRARCPFRHRWSPPGYRRGAGPPSCCSSAPKGMPTSAGR